MANLNLSPNQFTNANGLSLSASNNPIQFTFTTDIIGSSNYAYAYIHVQGPSITAGETITFNGRIYTASDDPAFNEFLTTTAHTRLQVAQSIAITLRNDPNNYGYDVQVYTQGAIMPMVFIAAKQPGSAYDITLALSIGSGFNIFGNQGGSDKYRGQQLSSYKVWAELNTNSNIAFAQFLNSVPAFSPGNELLAYYDIQWPASNAMTIDVAGVVNTQLAYERPNTTTGIYRQTSPIKPFFLEYGESFTPSGAVNELRNVIGRSNVFYAVNGALPTMAPNDLREYTKRQSLQLFLTEQPDNRMVRPTELNWLTFIWYSPGSAQHWIGAFIQAEFYDNSVVTVGTLFKQLMAPGYHTMRIDPNAWGMPTLEANQGKLVKAYSVYLVESLTASFTTAYKFSKIHNFVIDRLPASEGLISFAWLETIGGWSGFSFFGEVQTNISRDISDYERSRGTSYNSQDIMLGVARVGYDYANTASSGTLDLATYNWLRDSLLKSVQVYVVSGTTLIPIVIVAHEAKSGTNDFTFSLIVTFRLSAPVNTMNG